MKKRVKIPVGNHTQLLNLAKKVQAKHASDGDISPLKLLKWDDMTPAIHTAAIQHERAEALKREMKMAYQQRDLILDSITDMLRDSRDILSGVYKKEMKVLGQWGYDVAEFRPVKSSASSKTTSGE